MAVENTAAAEKALQLLVPYLSVCVLQSNDLEAKYESAKK
jgi:hypothetical protein